MHFLDIKEGLQNFFDPKARVRRREYNNAVTKMVAAIKQQHSLYRKEIQEWRMARFIAMAPVDPRRKRLIDLYEEIMSDAFIWGRWDTRKLRVSNKKLEVRNADGETDEEKTKLLQKGWARQFTKYNIDSIAYGYTLPYIKELDENGFIKKVDMVYRDHIVPETCEVLKSPEDKSGTPFDRPPVSRHLYFVHHTHTLGLLDKAAPLYIFKKHSWQNWDEFEEKFGIPMRIAKVASQDRKVLAEIDKWLKEMGSAAYARFPEGTDLEIKETSTTDAFNVFNEKRKACNEELATLIDGHFETAKDTGSRAKADSIIKANQDEITQDDEAFNLDVWNDTILPWLIELGYPFSPDDTVAYNENIVSSPEERLKIFEGVKRLGYNVKKEQIETELDVELDESPLPAPQKEGGKKDDPEDFLPNFKPPHGHGDGCGAHGADYRIIFDTVADALTPDEEKLLKAIYKGEVNWSYNEFRASHGELLDALTKGYGRIGIDYEADDHKMVALMRANIHRFGTDKTTAEIFQLNQILKDPEVDSFAKFRKRALRLFPNYKEHWLAAEHQQAFVSSQMGARYQEMMADIDVAPYWRLNAIIDDGTTTICRNLDGKVFRKDNAETWRFLPPNHWRCRSDAEDVISANEDEVAYMDDAVGADPDGWLRMVKSGHDINWGDEGQVFSANQSYLRRIQANEINLQSLSAVDFGLKGNFKSSLNAPTKRFDYAKAVDGNGNVRLLDVNWQPRWVSQTLLKNSDDGLVRALPETLAAPDEIYHWEEGADKLYRYLKHYKEFSTGVLVRFNRHTPATIEVIERADTRMRQGLLVHHRPDAIADAKERYRALEGHTKERFDEKTGGYLAIHPRHGRKERPKNVAIGHQLVDKGHRVQLLENIDKTTSADALIDGVHWEFKTLKEYTNLKRRVNKSVLQGSKQAPNILLYINGPYTYDAIVNGLQGAVAEDRARRIKSIAVMLGDGRLYVLSRKDIEDKRSSGLLK